MLVDILQYGQSEKCLITGPMWDFHAAKTVALMDELGIEQADFICNSWGGTIALEPGGATTPTACARSSSPAACRCSTARWLRLPERGHRGRTARDVYYGGEGPTREKMRKLITRLEWYDADRLPEETLDMRYEQSLDPEERGARRDVGLAARRLAGPDGAAGRIEAPTLFMWGREDAFLTPDYPMMLARMVPRGNLHVMDHVSHHLQEERPAAFHAVVDGFLRAIDHR